MPPYTFVRNGKVVDPDIVLTADVYPHALDRTVYAWDGGHHIPLCVKWPDNIKPGATCRETVGLIDIFATLADITGQPLKNDEAKDSYSFRNVLNGNLQTPARDHLIYLSSAGKLAIKKGPWKYHWGHRVRRVYPSFQASACKKWTYRAVIQPNWRFTWK